MCTRAADRKCSLLDAVRGHESMSVPAWPGGGDGACVTKPPPAPGPVTADRAERRSAAGCWLPEQVPGERQRRGPGRQRGGLPSPLLSEAGMAPRP